MNDQPQTIPADKVREIIARYRDGANYHGGRILADLKDLLPPPTLADMTMEERLACKWLQADLNGYGSRVVILGPYSEEGTARARVMYPTTRTRAVPWERITPRPDLPRLEWPGDQKVDDETPAKIGDVIESADDPRIPALPLGTVLLDRDNDATTKRSQAWTGAGYLPDAEEGTEYGPWKVLYIPKQNPEP